MAKSEIIEQQHRDEAKALARQSVEDMEAAAEAEDKLAQKASSIALDAYRMCAMRRCVREIAALKLPVARLEVEAAKHEAAVRRCTGVEFGHVRDRNKHSCAAKALHEAAALLKARASYRDAFERWANAMRFMGRGAEVSFGKFQGEILEYAAQAYGWGRTALTPTRWARCATDIAEFEEDNADEKLLESL